MATRMLYYPNQLKQDNTNIAKLTTTKKMKLINMWDYLKNTKTRKNEKQLTISATNAPTVTLSFPQKNVKYMASIVAVLWR